MKNYKIDVDHQTEFDGTQSDQSVTYIVEQNSGTVSAPIQKTLNGKDYRLYGWASNPLSVMPTDNTTIIATYKGHLLSGTSSAFSSNGQRKLIRDTYGRLNLVYESMDYSWLTISTDNGTTWSPEIKLAYTGGFSVNTQNRSPSIAIAASTGYEYIVYQCKLYPDYSSAGLVVSKYFNGIQQWTTIIDDAINDYNYDIKPVIAAVNSTIFVVYKPSASDPLYYVKLVDDYDGPDVYSRQQLTGSTSADSNPSIATGTGNNGSKFFLAYQQNETSVKYFEWGITSAPSGTPVDLSTGTGVTYHFTPCVSQNTGNPIVSWNYSGGYGSYGIVKRKSDTTWSSAYMISTLMGSGIHNNSRQTSTEGAIIAWKNASGVPQFIKLSGGSFSSIYSLSSTGEIQLSNGDDFANIKAITFNNTSSPYSLVPLSYNFNTLQKANLNDSISFGRLAIISAGKAEYSYYIGGIRVDGGEVIFKDFNRLSKLESSSELGNAMISENFELTHTNKLFFNSYYNSIKTENATESFADNGYISFRTELVSCSDNKIINSYNSVTFNSKNIKDSASISYEIDCSNFEPGEYYLRVIPQSNTLCNYFISEVQSDMRSELAKNNAINKTSENNIGIKDYDLFQNYPNPFNPSTTITYQHPKDGIVTLKIFDTLGNEVTTLVSEFKSKGKYEVNFNASALASGVYFYQINVNDYSASKKLILLK